MLFYECYCFFCEPAQRWSGQGWEMSVDGKPELASIVHGEFDVYYFPSFPDKLVITFRSKLPHILLIDWCFYCQRRYGEGEKRTERFRSSASGIQNQSSLKWLINFHLTTRFLAWQSTKSSWVSSDRPEFLKVIFTHLSAVAVARNDFQQTAMIIKNVGITILNTCIT